MRQPDQSSASTSRSSEPARKHPFSEATLLDVGQSATVLQLPAAPKTEAEREEQRRAEYAR